MKAKKKVVKARLLAIKGNYVLVLQNWNGKYTLPGGSKKKKETLMEALLREVEEEVGLYLNPVHLKKWHSKLKVKKLVQVHKNYFILPQPNNLVPINKEPHKFISVSWKPWYQVVELMDKEDRKMVLNYFTAVQKPLVN